MTVLHFWIYTQKEISELKGDLAKQFALRRFFHDSENTWEYLDGKSKVLNAHINISRECDWKAFLTEEKPLHILLSFRRTKKRRARIHKIGSKLQRHFGTIVHSGTLRHTEGTSYEFISSQTFSEPNSIKR